MAYTLPLPVPSSSAWVMDRFTPCPVLSMLFMPLPDDARASTSEALGVESLVEITMVLPRNQIELKVISSTVPIPLAGEPPGILRASSPLLALLSSSVATSFATSAGEMIVALALAVAALADSNDNSVPASRNAVAKMVHINVFINVACVAYYLNYMQQLR